jgi:hypothetical protein
MTCRWKGRANLPEYCSTCGNGTRAGCILDLNLSTRRNYSHGPYEFPKHQGALA